MVAQQNNVGDVACVSCERLQLGDDPEVPGPILRVWKQCCVQNLIIPRQLFRRIAEPAEISSDSFAAKVRKASPLSRALPSSLW